ncbi:alanine racemase [Microbacterium sp. NPDC055903]
MHVEVTARPTLETLSEGVVANLAMLRGRTSARVMAVVKADGYGLGLIPVARAAERAGAVSFGVTEIGEGAQLREAGLTLPVLAWLHPGGIDVELAVAHDIEVAVSSPSELRALSTLVPDGSTLHVHLNMDTGMARGGCAFAEWPDLLDAARDAERSGRLRVTGMMGHLPLADQADPSANAPAVRRMRDARDAALRAGLGPLTTHLAATAGVLTDPATHFDLVRVGAGLAGIDPSGTTELNAAARLSAPVVHTRFADRGTPVGYGAAHILDRGTHLSVIGVGYADGIPRELSPDAGVEIGGLRHPIVGRVSMDQIIVATGDIAVPQGTVATIFGPGGGAVPTLQDWAGWAGTIPHTIITGIGPRVRRSVA